MCLKGDKMEDDKKEKDTHLSENSLHTGYFCKLFCPLLKIKKSKSKVLSRVP